jgi:hypothetical protein
MPKANGIVIASCPDSVTLPRKTRGTTPEKAASKNEWRAAILWPTTRAKQTGLTSAFEAKSGIVNAKKMSELRALKLRHGAIPTAADNTHKERNKISGAAIPRVRSGIDPLSRVSLLDQAQRTIRGDRAM